MNPAYGIGVVAPDGWKLVGQWEFIEKGDTFVIENDTEGYNDPVECIETVGMAVRDCPFNAVFRKEAA